MPSRYRATCAERDALFYKELEYGNFDVTLNHFMASLPLCKTANHSVVTLSCATCRECYYFWLIFEVHFVVVSSRCSNNAWHVKSWMCTATSSRTALLDASVTNNRISVINSRITPLRHAFRARPGVKAALSSAFLQRAGRVRNWIGATTPSDAGGRSTKNGKRRRRNKEIRACRASLF